MGASAPVRNCRPLVLGGSGITTFPVSVAAADLDGDGDLVSANSSGNNLTAFLQIFPGAFVDPPIELGDNLTVFWGGR